MMNNKLFYFDSADAKSLDLTVSNDYAFSFIANLPLDDDVNSLPGADESLEDKLTRLIRQSDSVGIFITDILFYRFLLSVTLSFSLSKQPEVSALLVSSSERIFDSMDRTAVWNLMNHPEIGTVESVFGEIVSAAQAENEIVAIPLFSKWRSIRAGLYSGDSINVLSGFSKTARMVSTFPLRVNKPKLEDVIKGSSEIIIANERSAILDFFPGITAIRGEQDVFNSLFKFCESICTIFSAIFIDGKKSEDLDDAYRRIWTFLLRSKSSCFVPSSVIKKAKEVLL